MENNNALKILSIDEFLQKYELAVEQLTNKEKLKYLRLIRDNCRTQCDITELQYHNNTLCEKDYVTTISDLEMQQDIAQTYILKIKRIEKVNRKLKIKKAIQKILPVLK